MYDTLENYTKEKTNINKIYLACGKVLEMAHNFYLKNGFNQIYKLDIKMHFSDDDDFFVKSIKDKQKISKSKFCLFFVINVIFY